MTATDRRRNLRAENCRKCGAFCEAGAGFLYRLTTGVKARTIHNHTGRWGWFVKCERCHAGETEKAGRVPVSRWGVRDVAKWGIDTTTDEYGVTESWLTAGAERLMVAGPDRVGVGFHPLVPFYAGDPVAGRELTEKAAAVLNERVAEVVRQHQEPDPCP